MELNELPVVAYGWENTMIGKSGLMLVQLDPGQYPEIPAKLVRLDDALALMSEQVATVAKYKAGNTALLEALMDMVHQHCTSGADEVHHGYISSGEAAVEVLEQAGMLIDGKLQWQALEDRKPKRQTWEQAVNECITDPEQRARLLAMSYESYSNDSDSDSKKPNGLATEAANPLMSNEKLAEWTGLEPATPGVTGRSQK